MSNKTKADKVKTDKVKTDKVKTDKVKTDKVKTDKVKTDKVKTDKVKVKIDGRRIGKSIIDKVVRVKLHGNKYNQIQTLDGLIFTLNDKDFNLQVSK
jgi:hypothetical protein